MKRKEKLDVEFASNLIILQCIKESSAVAKWRIGFYLCSTRETITMLISQTFRVFYGFYF